MVGFDPREVGTTAVAADRGLTPGRLQGLALVGEPLENVVVSDYVRGIQASVDPGLVPRALRWLLGVGAEASDGYDENASTRSVMHAVSHSWLWRQLLASPRAGPECTACGFCVKHCPVNAIEIVDGRARMDTRKCIRCYCCHELCPALAVELYRPLLGKLVFGA
jgi:ferredoxin